MAVKCTGYLLGCSCLLVAMVVVLYSWEGLYVAVGSDLVQRDSKLGVPSRYLMQIAPAQGQEGAAAAAATAAGGSPVSALLLDTETRTLLDRVTSKLQCLGTSANEHFQSDRDAIDSLVDMNSPNSGYIAVVSFHEQQTKASENLFALQCWARALRGVNIVEPFIDKSHLIVPLNSSQRTLLRYRDIFDLGIWQLLSVRHKFPPLTSWETFLARAPRQLVVVRFRYLTVVRSKKFMYRNESVVHLAVDNTFKEGCRPTAPALATKIEFLTRLHNFTVIRDVCVNFANGDQLTLHQFKRHLYGGVDPGKVTVLMEEWRGFSYVNNGKRVSLSNACPLSSILPLSYTWPSRQLICDARKYRHKHLGTSNYMTLMVRTEKMLTLNSSKEYMAHCLRETLRQWQLLKAAHEIDATFLSMDIGTHGSFSLMEKDRSRYSPFVELYEGFIRTVLGPQATLRTWEMGFEEVSSHRDSGYIGSLQKTLAAQSRCIVFTGGGSFQKHAKYMYERVVPKRKQCVSVISECSRGIVAKR